MTSTILVNNTDEIISINETSPLLTRSEFSSPLMIHYGTQHSVTWVSFCFVFLLN